MEEEDENPEAPFTWDGRIHQGNDPLHHPLAIQATLDWPQATLYACLEHEVVWAWPPSDRYVAAFAGLSRYVGLQRKALECAYTWVLHPDFFPFDSNCDFLELGQIHIDDWPKIWRAFGQNNKGEWRVLANVEVEDIHARKRWPEEYKAYIKDRGY